MKKEVIQIENKNGAGLKGTHVISLCKIESEKARALEVQLEVVRLKRSAAMKLGQLTEAMAQALHDEYKYYLNLLHRYFLQDQRLVNNVTVNEGRSVIAQRLGGVTTYTGIVNYGALGSDNTAAAVTDTELNTEVYRKALSSGTYSGQTVYLENFYTATETSGTFEEYGFFIDGTASVDSGQMINRFVSSVTKSTLQSLNVASTIVISDV